MKSSLKQSCEYNFPHPSAKGRAVQHHRAQLLIDEGLAPNDEPAVACLGVADKRMLFSDTGNYLRLPGD